MLRPAAIRTALTSLALSMEAMRRQLIIVDAVIAKNDDEAAQLWRMRHATAEAERVRGAGIEARHIGAGLQNRRIPG